MWGNHDSDAAMKFHEATSEWFGTWDGTDAAMQVEDGAKRYPFSHPAGEFSPQNLSSFVKHD